MDKLLEIGVVVKPQGIKGEVKIMPYADSPGDLKDVKTVYIDKVEYQVASFRHDGKMAYLKLAGIDTMDSADALRGKEMLADMRSVYELPQGRYFIVDIIGCEVIDESGNRMGSVSGVIQGVAQDVYTVKMDKGSFMMPVVDFVVKDIDTELRKIVVDAKRLKEVALYEN